MRNSVAACRAELGWSQSRLAEALGVSRQTVISIEKGHFDPSLPLAFRLAGVFGRTIEDLFDPDDVPATTATMTAPTTAGGIRYGSAAFPTVGARTPRMARRRTGSTVHEVGSLLTCQIKR